MVTGALTTILATIQAISFILGTTSTIMALAKNKKEVKGREVK
jgi:hypothetical protein